MIDAHLHTSFAQTMCALTTAKTRNEKQKINTARMCWLTKIQCTRTPNSGIPERRIPEFRPAEDFNNSFRLVQSMREEVNSNEKKISSKIESTPSIEMGLELWAVTSSTHPRPGNVNQLNRRRQISIKWQRVDSTIHVCRRSWPDIDGKSSMGKNQQPKVVANETDRDQSKYRRKNAKSKQE